MSFDDRFEREQTPATITLGAWMCCKVIGVGGQLALGVISERREFLQAMKEFLITARQQGTGSKP